MPPAKRRVAEQVAPSSPSHSPQDKTPFRSKRAANSAANATPQKATPRTNKATSKTPVRATANNNPLRASQREMQPDKDNGRNVLNLLLAKGYISCDMLSGLVKDQPCADVIEDINNNIRFMQLEIRKLVYEVDGAEYWAIVNNNADATAKLASTLDELQLTFVKALLQLIIGTTGMVAVNAVPRCLRTLAPEVAKKVTPAIRDKTLSVLEKEGWLLKQHDKYYMGVRSYADLRTLIASAQLTCCFCHSTCILGRKHGSGCVAKIHHHCAMKWFENSHDQKCPRCHAPWVNEEGEQEPEDFGSQQSQED